MDVEKIINDLIEEYELFYSGTSEDFLDTKGIHLHSKVATLFRYLLRVEPLSSYHISKTNSYLKSHPQVTFKDLCLEDSLWYW